MTRLILSLLGCVCVALAAQAADPPARSTPRTDAFVAQVAGGNTFEIESSKLALTRTKADPVRAFANKMVTDHTEAEVKFKKAIGEAKVPAPAEGMDAKHKAVFDDLRKKDAAAFDEAYVEAQHKAHKETVDLFEAYASGGDNARIRQFAQEMLPTLRAHRDQVSKIKTH